MYCCSYFLSLFFFFNDTATTEIYTLSLHDALPIYSQFAEEQTEPQPELDGGVMLQPMVAIEVEPEDRKSTRLNSSHSQISYAVFCLKKKKKKKTIKTHKQTKINTDKNDNQQAKQAL